MLQGAPPSRSPPLPNQNARSKAPFVYLSARVLVHVHRVVSAAVLRRVTAAVEVAVRGRSDGLEGGRVRAPALHTSSARNKTSVDKKGGTSKG